MSLLDPWPPEDFAEFWSDAVAAAKSLPLSAEVTGHGPEGDETRTTLTWSMRGSDGTPRYGWYSFPTGGSGLPAFVWIPPYGRWSMLPDKYGTRAGFASLSLNFFGEGPFHQETYVPARGYFAEGVMEPHTFVFRRMFQDLVLATRVLENFVEVDSSRIGAMGLSQGGGMAIWLAAWYHKIKSVCADMPFLGGMRYVFDRPVYRYPLKEVSDAMQQVALGRERAMNTFSYYDTVNHATLCKVPTLVTFGSKDPAVRPEQVRAIFEALPGEKEIVELDWGHDWHESMVDRNMRWLMRHLTERC